jgi:hypothetical protein
MSSNGITVIAAAIDDDFISINLQSFIIFCNNVFTLTFYCLYRIQFKLNCIVAFDIEILTKSIWQISNCQKFALDCFNILEFNNEFYMQKNCCVCSRKVLTTKKYCFYHNQALDDIKEHYAKWVYAYGVISWNDFLNRLLYMDETGSWIKEVISVELKM